MELRRLEDMYAPPADLVDSGARVISLLESRFQTYDVSLLEVGEWNRGGLEEYVFAFAPGLCLQMHRDPVHSGEEWWQLTAKTLCDAVAHAETLARSHSEFSFCLRRIVADAQSEGLPVRMHRIDVGELAWSVNSDPLFLAGYEGLSDSLQQTTFWISASTTTELEHAFAHDLIEQKSRRDALIALGHAGADGTIDQLALRAVLAQAKPEVTLRRLRHSEVLELDNGVVLAWKNGHVTSGLASPSAAMSWNGSWVTLHDVLVSETAIALALDRPVTNLIEHPAFSDDMIVKNVVRNESIDDIYTDVELDLPISYIDVNTGRHWTN